MTPSLDAIATIQALREAEATAERDEQIDAICEYLGIEIVLTKSGRRKCIKVEPEKPKNDHIREQDGYYGQ